MVTSTLIGGVAQLAPPAPKRRILLFDSSRASRDARATALRRVGFDVVCTGAPTETLFLYQPNVYVLVLEDFSDPAGAIQLCSDVKKVDGTQLVAFLVGAPPYVVLPEASAAFVPKQATTRGRESSAEMVSRIRRTEPDSVGLQQAGRLISLFRASRQQ